MKIMDEKYYLCITKTTITLTCIPEEIVKMYQSLKPGEGVFIKTGAMADLVEEQNALGKIFGFGKDGI